MTRRCLVLWLALALASPNPAFALRPRASGLEERTPVTRELGHTLTQTVSAGTEEKEFNALALDEQRLRAALNGLPGLRSAEDLIPIVRAIMKARSEGSFDSWRDVEDRLKGVLGPARIKFLRNAGINVQRPAAQVPYPPAVLPSVLDGGVRALALVFRNPPDYSGLGLLEQAIQALPPAPRELLSASLQRIQTAPDVASRWAAVDEWLRVLNERLLIPQGRVVAVEFAPTAGGGIELASQAYQQFEAVEWWDVEGVRLPVVYVKRLHRPYETTTGRTVPAVVLMNLHAHTIQQRETLAQWSGPDNSLRHLLRRLWPTPPDRDRTARFLLEETRREELRHLQMMRRTIPAIMQAAGPGAPLPKSQVRNLLGLQMASPMVGGMLTAWRRETLSAQETQVVFLHATEIAAVLDRLRRPGENLWALHDALSNAALHTATLQGQVIENPSEFRTSSLWLVVDHLFHRQQEVAPTPDVHDRVAEIISKLPTDQLAQFASALRDSEFRPEAVPSSDPGQQTWPATPADQESAMWRLARLVAAGAEEVQLGEPRPLAGNPAVGQVIPVVVAGDGRWAQGRAVVLDPRRVVIRQFVNPDVTKPGWPGPAIRTLPPARQPGLRLAEFVATPPASWGRPPRSVAVRMPVTLALAMNGLQMNFWEDPAFLVMDGVLVKTVKGRWPEAPRVFVLDEEHPGLRQLPLDDGQPVVEGIREAIPGPVLVRDDRDVSSDIRQYPAGQPNPNQVRWDPATTRAAFSALGKTADGRLIWFAVGGMDDQHGVGRASVQDVAQAMLKLGAVEAILLGGSMDVQQWLPEDGAVPGVLGRHIQPPHDAERRLNSAVFVYASARQPDETFVQQVQGFSRALRAMVHDVYPQYGAPAFLGIAGVRNPQAPWGGGGIPEELLPAMTSLDAAAAMYAPAGNVGAARGEVSQAELALRDFLREDQGKNATSQEFRQRVKAFADTLDHFWRQSAERPSQHSSPTTGLEEPADPGDSTVLAPDPATATAADVADYLGRRWKVPVHHDPSEVAYHFFVRSPEMPQAAWGFHEIRPHQPGRIPADISETFNLRLDAAVPPRMLVYPEPTLPRFRPSGTSMWSTSLGFVEGLDYPVVIKLSAMGDPGREALIADVVGHLGIGPRMRGMVSSPDGDEGYAMELAPGKSLEIADPSAINRNDLQIIDQRLEEAGLDRGEIIQMPPRRLGMIDAGNSAILDVERFKAWITAQNAGWAIHELGVDDARMTGGYLLSHEAVVAALALLKAPTVSDLPLPVIALVTLAEQQRLRAIARQGGFSDDVVAQWENRYLRQYQPDGPRTLEQAAADATVDLAVRLRLGTITPTTVSSLPGAFAAFRPAFLQLLSDIGLTIRAETLGDQALQDLYRAAQA